MVDRAADYCPVDRVETKGRISMRPYLLSPLSPVAAVGYVLHAIRGGIFPAHDAE
jgi:hypothetical protein